MSEAWRDSYDSWRLMSPYDDPMLYGDESEDDEPRDEDDE